MVTSKVENLEDGEVIFFINTNDFLFAPIKGVDYSPKIKTLIRVMDTPEEDTFHHYIE
jgi:hypothetical protein